MSRNLVLLSAAVLGAAGLVASVAGAPDAQAQPLTCLKMPNGAPRMVTATASASTQAAAASSAQSKWSTNALVYGQAYAYWLKAANKTTTCSSYISGVQRRYSCTVAAQPCR